MTGVEGWPIHGRRRYQPLGIDFVSRSDFEAAQEASDLMYAANRLVGLADISDATVARIAEYLRRDDT